MRSVNGPMDFITREEFESEMERFATKEDLEVALAATTAQLSSKIEDVKVEILATTQTNLAEALAPLTAKIDATGAKMGTLETKVDALETKVDALETKVDAIDAKVDAIEAKVDVLETKMDALETKMDATDVRLLHMETRLDEMSVKIDTVVIDGFRVLGNKMDDFIVEMRGIVKTHERRLDEHDAQFYALRQSGGRS